MKISNALLFRVSKIIQNKQFVKDILHSIAQRSGRAVLVGGAVRDLFLDLPTKDLDFEVYGLSLGQLEEVLAQFGRVSLVGKSFGVLRVHGLDVDWSLPRKDSSGRHPEVAYDPDMSYEQAFARRDITINAMGIDMQSFELIDPYNGLYDLHHKILRAADLNFFAQDPLRLLRVMQFVGRFEMQVDEKLSQLCSVMDISKVSHERVEQEFAKLFLQSRRPSIGLQWLVHINKFDELLPGVQKVQSLWSKLNFTAGSQFFDEQAKLVMMWAVVISFLLREKKDFTFQQLSYKDKQPYIDFIKRMTRNDQLITKISGLVVYAQIIPASLSDIQIKWLAVWLAPQLSIAQLCQCMLILYGWQRAIDLAEQAKKLGVLNEPLAPLLTGKDFLDVAQGVELGKLVKAAYKQQIDQGLTDRFVLKNLVLKGKA